MFIANALITAAAALVFGLERAMYGIMVAHYKSGEAAEKEGKMDEAKQYCGKCIDVGNELIRIDANRPEAWQVRGYCKRIVGDTAGAAVDLKRFTELRSQSSSR